MCITKIEAFKDSKGGIHPLETAALAAEVIIVTGFNAASANAMFDNADKLIPLLQRHAAIQAEKAKAAAASAEPTTLSASEAEPIPELVYWCEEHSNFYGVQSRKGQGEAFFKTWYPRRDEFPITVHEDDTGAN